MPYAQRNYNEIQGINGRYRINQIGCFLTAFSNLFERFGRPKDPIVLNAFLRDRNIYKDVDDGVRDDLWWAAVSTLDPNIVVTGSGSGRPPHSNAIVKFTFKSTTTNKWGTHFSLVADAHAGTIIDSWDGKVKSWNAYGGPKQWATYQDNMPKPAPVSQPQASVATQQAVPPRHIRIEKGWGISHAAKAYGYKDYGSQDRWNAIAQLNGQANADSFKLSTGQVIRMEAEPSVTPAAPVQAEQPNIVAITAQKGWGISHILEAAGYSKEAYSDAYQWVKFSELNGAPQGQNIHITPGTSYRVHRTPVERPKPIEVVAEPAPAPVEQPQIQGASIEAPVTPAAEVEPVEAVTAQAADYVGPLQEDDDEIFDLNAAKEARIMAGELTSYERLVNVVAKIQGFWLSLLTKLKINKEK